MNTTLDCELLAIYLNTSMQKWPAATLLRKPEVQQIGGKTFVVGILYGRDQQRWAMGMRCSIALEAVHAMIEFPTIEDYNRHHVERAPDGKDLP
jgi:hypothetical protein